METIVINRQVSTQHGTFGVMFAGDIPFALTLEREWLDNKTGVSCIPDGEYLCERVNSPKFGNTFEVTNVPGRTHILFHKGNLDDDSHGCILIGEQFGYLKDQPAIISSREGFSEFMQHLAGQQEFRLIITWYRKD